MDFKGQEFSIPAIFNASVCRESLCRVVLSENMLYHGILQIHRLIIIFSMTIWGHPPFSDKLMLLVSFPPGTILTIHTIHSQRLHTSSTQIVYTNRLHKSLHKSFSRVFFKVRVFSQENICNRNYVMVCGPGEDGQRGERIPKGGKKGKGKACRPCRLPSHHCGFGSDVEVYIRYN